MRQRNGVWRSHELLPLDAHHQSQPLRVLVTGSRTWPVTLRSEVVDALGFYWELGGSLTVVHGDCPKGPDRMARQWCERMNGGIMGQMVTEERHPADWARGIAAGYHRNEEMVGLGARVCLAFMDVCRKPTCTRRPKQHASHGTAHCAAEAEKAGIEVVRYQTWWEPELRDTDMSTMHGDFTTDVLLDGARNPTEDW